MPRETASGLDASVKDLIVHHRRHATKRTRDPFPYPPSRARRKLGKIVTNTRYIRQCQRLTDVLQSGVHDPLHHQKFRTQATM